MMSRTLGGLFLVLAATPASAAINFSDGTFTPSNYTIQITDAATGSGNTVTVGQCATCGVAGGLGFRIMLSEPTGIGPQEFGAAVNNLFSYTPSSQGTITNIDASVAKNFTVNAATAFNNTFRPIIYQNGQFYSAVLFGTAVTGPTSTGFNTFDIPNLTAASFLQFDVATDAFLGTQHPDFSGSTILFGIGQLLASSNQTNTVVTSEFDNLSFTLTTAVPEPGSLALLAAGLVGILGLQVTRKSFFWDQKKQKTL